MVYRHIAILVFCPWRGRFNAPANCHTAPNAWPWAARTQKIWIVQLTPPHRSEEQSWRGNLQLFFNFTAHREANLQQLINYQGVWWWVMSILRLRLFHLMSSTRKMLQISKSSKIPLAQYWFTVQKKSHACEREREKGIKARGSILTAHGTR